MSRTHTPREQVFAVIRQDLFHTEIENQFYITKVLMTAADAEAEVQRLNQVNADKECRYYWQETRLFRDAAGENE